ncbi:VOC family protein [Anaerovibrio sp. RM50]|uniref:VOC family protein n=1 Tax=Anaerovibrio sp. RM50 TaxID=1200557 RepID=UPI000488DC7A|nr:VOC family protein [Anaerovibrio sp. RM50]
MVQLRHVGIYVHSLKRETEFYRQVFNMHEICNDVEQKDELIDELLSVHESVRITKLITEHGKLTGSGDMVELVEYPNSPYKDSVDYEIYKTGVMHLGFGIDDMDATLSRLKKMGGKQKTSVHIMANGNKCCFCQDPEGNWLELIERRQA